MCVSFDAILTALVQKDEFGVSVEATSKSGIPSLTVASRENSPIHVTYLRSWIVAWPTFLDIESFFHPPIIARTISNWRRLVTFLLNYTPHGWISCACFFSRHIALHYDTSWDIEAARFSLTAFGVKDSQNGITRGQAVGAGLHVSSAVWKAIYSGPIPN